MGATLQQGLIETDALKTLPLTYKLEAYDPARYPPTPESTSNKVVAKV